MKNRKNKRKEISISNLELISLCMLLYVIICMTLIAPLFQEDTLFLLIAVVPIEVILVIMCALLVYLGFKQGIFRDAKYLRKVRKHLTNEWQTFKVKNPDDFPDIADYLIDALGKVDLKIDEKNVVHIRIILSTSTNPLILITTNYSWVCENILF